MSKEKKPHKDKGGRTNGAAGKFASVTSHLRSKDFKWLKDDMGFFELPENWESVFGNDNRRSSAL